MGSPESSSECISSSTSLPLSNPNRAQQESPIFSYISNLSPIKPDGTVPVSKGFPGINSPSFEFRSPQSNPSEKRNCLERALSGRSSAAESSRPNIEDADIVAEKSGISNNQLRSDSTSSPQNYVRAKASSIPGNTNDHLSVIVNMEGGRFASSPNLSPINSDDIFQSQNDLVGPEESVEKTDNKDNAAKEKLKTGAPPVIFEQAEKNDLGPSLSHLKSFESVQKSGDSDMLQDAHQKVDHNSSEEHVVNNQTGEEPKPEPEGSDRYEVGFTSQLGCMHSAQDSGVRENAARRIASSGKNSHECSAKVGQHQHGINRRLQFGDAHREKMADIGFQVSSARAGYPRFTASSADAEAPESASLYDPVNCTMISSQNSGNHNIKVPKPSGIGLHLNSIIAKQRESASKVSENSEGGSFDGLGRKSVAIMSRHMQNNYTISSNVMGGASFSSNGRVRDAATSIGGSSVETPCSMKPLFEPVVLEPKLLLQSNYSDKRKYNSETFDSFDDIVPLSPKKKTKKSIDGGDGSGCKRCNCKKTKCLKLYCDCFAAGIYCAEPCACQGCYNRPEYEDTVLETRQQIESRNPLAFAPKIIQHISESPTNVSTDEGDFTPSSGRHKRGCNCKKSKCLKKYCECYQANVGCSDGCRCEGCDNVYGRKEEYRIVKELVSKQGNSEKLDNSFEMMLSKGDLMQNDLYSPPNVTPLTPPFQSSINGNGAASRPWFSGGRYLQSPESDLNLTTPLALSRLPVKDPDHRDMIPETNSQIMDLVSFQGSFNSGNEQHTANHFSPCDGPSNVDNLTPAAFPNPSRPQIFPGICEVSSESYPRWRRSPITPSSHTGANKPYEVADFEDSLYSVMDDDTPEILKDNPLPSNAVKVSSPNKKRVSPPHGRLLELGSGSSAGLRTCRRFVLRGIPPMPPTTPGIQSQDDPDKNTAHSQSSSCSK